MSAPSDGARADARKRLAESTQRDCELAKGVKALADECERLIETEVMSRTVSLIYAVHIERLLALLTRHDPAHFEEPGR